MFDFELSDKDTRSEQALAELLLPRVQRGQILLADRLYCDGRKWYLATMNGADAIFRAKSDTNLPVQKRLADGSYMSVLTEGNSRKPSAKFHPVRVIEYRLGRKDPVYRLLTTLWPDQATPEEIAHLYLERWNWEEVADELKTALNPSSDVMRSNTPELVKQEFVGKLIAHFCVRSFMHEQRWSQTLTLTGFIQAFIECAQEKSRICRRFFPLKSFTVRLFRKYCRSGIRPQRGALIQERLNT